MQGICVSRCGSLARIGFPVSVWFPCITNILDPVKDGNNQLLRSFGDIWSYNNSKFKWISLWCIKWVSLLPT
jgi:hypothetical protein